MQSKFPGMLAQRSSEAATKGRIVKGDSQANEGVEPVNEHRVHSIKRVAAIVSKVDTASKQQCLWVEELNKAVSQMNEMTQQNAALVRASTAASRAFP
jgi:methyl-accepting chemotaxis protein